MGEVPRVVLVHGTISEGVVGAYVLRSGTLTRTGSFGSTDRLRIKVGPFRWFRRRAEAVLSTTRVTCLETGASSYEISGVWSNISEDTRVERIAAEYPEQGFVVRGRGLMMGIACDSDPTLAGRVSKAAFERGLVIETSGAFDEVLKFFPALTITEDELRRGLEIVRESLAAVLAG